MFDPKSTHSRKPRHDIRAAILANSLLPLGRREPAEALANRFGVKLSTIYSTTIRMRKRGLLGPAAGPNRGPYKTAKKVDSPDGPIFDLGSVPDRTQRRVVLANMIATGSNSDRQAAITSLNRMDAEDQTNDAPDIPATRPAKVECIYRILLACPPDILEEALARRQHDLTKPPAIIDAPEAPPEEEDQPEPAPPDPEDLPENAGLPAGGGDLA